MHGLIFVTWEKYLEERFGTLLLQKYRDAVGEVPATAPLANRVYDDDALLAGVNAAHQLMGFSVDTLLQEYGRYFLMNGLTSYRCAYILSQAHTARDLLLMMRQAHGQMRRTPDALTPPLFMYETISEDNSTLRLIYDSPRQLCPLLKGAIEGAAMRYHETAHIVERSCMRKGATVCRFDIFFSSSSRSLPPQETPQQRELRQRQQQLAGVVLSLLPYEGGLTWVELQGQLRLRQVNRDSLRPRMLLEAIQHLEHAGLVASTANQPGDTMDSRRYWRVPTSDREKRL